MAYCQVEDTPLRQTGTTLELFNEPQLRGRRARRRVLERGDTEFPASANLPERYRPLVVLGRGGLGLVVLAHDRLLDREVAVKVVGHPGDEPDRERMLREVRALGRINHPNVVTVYDADLTSGCLVMEFLPGVSLREELRQGPIDPTELHFLARDLFGALDAVHSAGLAHRDVKPQNLLRRSDGTCVLVDLGISHPLRCPGNGSECEAQGTPGFVAPEILQGAHASVGADLYSAGVTLLWLLTGRRLGSDGAPRVASEELYDICAGDALLAQSIGWCLAEDAAHRPASAAALLEILGRRHQRSGATR